MISGMHRARHSIVLSSLLLAAGCGDGGDQAEPDPEPFVEIVREAVLTEEAYYLEGEAGVADLRVDGARLIFSAEAVPEGLVPGAVVLGGADGGYVRRVLSAEWVDGVVTVETEIASPGDFFEDLAIRFRPELVQAQALTADGYATSRRGVSTTVGVSWSPGKTCLAGGVELSPDELPDIDYRIHVAPIFDVDKVDGEFVVSVGLSGSASADIEVTGQLQGNMTCTIALPDDALMEFPVTVPVPTPLGVPVPLKMKLKVGPHAFGEISVTANADVSVQAHAEGALELALDYTWGGRLEARDTGANASVSLDYDLGDDGYQLSMARGGGLTFALELYETVGLTLQVSQTVRSAVAASPVTCKTSSSEEVTLDVSLGVDAKLPFVDNGPEAYATISESWPLHAEPVEEGTIPGCTPGTGVLAKIAERLECARINPYMQGLRHRRKVFPKEGRTEESDEMGWFAFETPNCFGESYMLAPTITGNTFTLRWHKVLNGWTRDWTLAGTLAPDEQSLSRLQLDYTGTLDDETHPQEETAQLVLSNVALEVDNDRFVAFEGTFDAGMSIETMSFRNYSETWTHTPHDGLELWFYQEDTMDTCNEDFATTKFELELRLEDP